MNADEEPRLDARFESPERSTQQVRYARRMERYIVVLAACALDRDGRQGNQARRSSQPEFGFIGAILPPSRGRAEIAEHFLKLADPLLGIDCAPLMMGAVDRLRQPVALDRLEQIVDHRA